MQGGDDAAQFAACVGLGHCCFKLDDHLAAVDWHKQALTLSEGVPDGAAPELVELLMGNAYLLLSDLDAACECYSRGLARAHDSGSRVAMSRAYCCVASACYEKKDLRSAAKYFKKSMQIAEVGREESEAGVECDVLCVLSAMTWADQGPCTPRIACAHAFCASRATLMVRRYPLPRAPQCRMIKNEGGGASPKTPSPPPQTKVTIAGKNEIYNRENLVRPFLVHQVLGPKPPPPPPLLKRSPAPPPPWGENRHLKNTPPPWGEPSRHWGGYFRRGGGIPLYKTLR